MSADVTGDHTIRIHSTLGLPVVIEATAMFLDDLVEGQTVGERTFIFELVEAGGEEVVITARLRHPQYENPVRTALTPIYNLMAGFYRAGADVSVAGVLADVLPGHGTLAHNPTRPRPLDGIRQIFEDHLTPAEKTPAVSPPHLAEVFHVLSNVREFAQRQHDPTFRAIFPTLVKDHRDDVTYYLTHRSGLEFVALVKDDAVYAHGIHKHKPLSARLRFDWVDVSPRPARTWGEVWVNHAFGGRFRRPGGLEILPDEIALIHDISIRRCAIADRGSLADLTDLSFGPGTSPAYPADVWLGIAEQHGENQGYQTALRCAEQAALLDESAEMNARARQEIERWQGWIAFAAEQAANGDQAAEIEPAPLRPLTELLAQLTPACAAHLKEVCEEIQYEVWEAHDFHRQPRPLRAMGLGSGRDRLQLEYRRVTGQTMLDAGVTLGALAHLGHRFTVIPPPAILDDVFTIECGSTVIWGTVASQALILRDDPGVAYSAKP